MHTLEGPESRGSLGYLSVVVMLKWPSLGEGSKGSRTIPEITIQGLKIGVKQRPKSLRAGVGPGPFHWVVKAGGMARRMLGCVNSAVSAAAAHPLLLFFHRTASGASVGG
jgi:hypothetical protein